MQLLDDHAWIKHYYGCKYNSLYPILPFMESYQLSIPSFETLYICSKDAPR